MKRNYLKPLSVIALLSAVMMALIGGRAIALPEPAAVDAADLTQSVRWYGGPESFSELVAQVTPAVVNISIIGKSPMSAVTRQGGRPHGYPPQGTPPQGFPSSPFDEFFREFFEGNGGMRSMPDGQMPQQQFRAVGSGFIVSADGFVVTNNHVIEHAEDIEVIVQDGSRYPATVQGRDPKTDLALLKINVDEDLAFVELGDSDAARVGDWVLAVGNPFGLGGTVTAGIISARGRDIQAGPFDDFLQIDAPINRGNSGGPLFNAAGQVIGINTAIYSPSGGSVGIGFAIPATMAGSVIEQLQTAGVVERGWLGVQFQAVSEALAESLDLDEARGALVAAVVEGGPADEAGMRTGDVIVSLDGEPLDDPKDLPRLVANVKAGTEVRIDVLRNGKTHGLDVEIGRSEPEVLASRDVQPESPARLGVMLSSLTKEARQRYGIPASSDGVLVTGVGRNSPAARAGIRPGHLITMVGQTDVASPEEVVDEVTRLAEAGRESVLLLVEQRGARQFVAVELVV